MDDILLSGVSKSFQGQSVLSNLSGTIPGGRVTAVMGASGRGKTTLLRLLCGLLQPDSGSISGLNGYIPSVVFQEDRLMMSLSVRDNLAVVLKAGQLQQAEGLLEKLGMPGIMSKRISKLSGGMARRVALTRALLYPGDLLLMDEPFKGLDEPMKERAARVIKERVSGLIPETIGCATTVLVTHDPLEAQLLGAHEIIQLDQVMKG